MKRIDKKSATYDMFLNVHFSTPVSFPRKKRSLSISSSGSDSSTHFPSEKRIQYKKIPRYIRCFSLFYGKNLFSSFFRLTCTGKCRKTTATCVTALALYVGSSERAGLQTEKGGNGGSYVMSGQLLFCQFDAKRKGGGEIVVSAIFVQSVLLDWRRGEC